MIRRFHDSCDLFHIAGIQDLQPLDFRPAEPIQSPIQTPLRYQHQIWTVPQPSRHQFSFLPMDPIVHDVARRQIQPWWKRRDLPVLLGRSIQRHASTVADHPRVSIHRSLKSSHPPTPWIPKKQRLDKAPGSGAQTTPPRFRWRGLSSAHLHLRPPFSPLTPFFLSQPRHSTLSSPPWKTRTTR